MKKLLSITALALFSAVGVQAQHFTLQNDTMVLNTTGSSSFLYLHNYVNNISTESFTFNWRLIDVGPLPIGWTYDGFCDNKTCYGGSHAWTTGTTMTSISLGAGLKSDLKLQINVPPTGENASKVIRFEVKVLDQIDTAVFIVNKNPASINAIGNDDARVAVFPNPVVNDLYININSDLKAQSIRIYNIDGQEVLTSAVNSDKMNINTSSLSDGIYSVQILGNNGVITSRKFVKK